MFLKKYKKITVSIHASVKDATIRAFSAPTPARVSIHASVKDATKRWRKNMGRVYSFNPRIRKGCDRSDPYCTHSTRCFNPRIRKGCDRNFSWSGMSGCGFNPRIRKGCDYFPGSFLNFGLVSIHASVKDATNRCRLLSYLLWVSIHASVKDATNIKLQ